jgi:glycosyltransferase involved in cell wall biosynthesis
MSESQLSIVIPVKNRQCYIKSVLDDVLAQTYRPLTVIVVDNNSTDGTRSEIDNWARLHSSEDFSVIVLEEKEPGASAARNRGLARVTTPWVMFFDSDDTMTPDHVQRAMAGVSDNVDIVGWTISRVELDKSVRHLPFTPHDIEYNTLFHATLATQRYMVRTEVARAARGWNREVMRWNDIEFGLRVLAVSHSARQVSGDSTVTVRAVEDSITGTRFSSSIDDILFALSQMAKTLGPERRHWIRLKTVIYAAVCSREKHPRADLIFREVLGEEPCWARRLMWRLAYSYTRHGGRGIARILRPFM